MTRAAFSKDYRKDVVTRDVLSKNYRKDLVTRDVLSKDYRKDLVTRDVLIRKIAMHVANNTVKSVKMIKLHFLAIVMCLKYFMLQVLHEEMRLV